MFQCSWVKQTTLIWVTLPWPRPTHICTQEVTHSVTKHADPQWGDLFDTELYVFIPFLLRNDSVSTGGFERLKPCLEDNLGVTIWSRFRSDFSGSSLFSHERKQKQKLFVVFKSNSNVTWLWFTLQMDNWTSIVAETATFAAAHASGELYNLYLHHYWSLPVASAHLAASAIALTTQFSRCWHRKFNLDIFVMMKVVVIGLK